MIITAGAVWLVTAIGVVVASRCSYNFQDYNGCPDWLMLNSIKIGFLAWLFRTSSTWHWRLFN